MSAMSSENPKVGWLKVEDATLEELNHINQVVEEELPEEYKIIVSDDRINWLDHEEVMQFLIHIFHFLETECFDDKTEAIKNVRDDAQKNLRRDYQ